MWTKSVWNVKWSHKFKSRQLKKSKRKKSLQLLVLLVVGFLVIPFTAQKWSIKKIWNKISWTVLSILYFPQRKKWFRNRTFCARLALLTQAAQGVSSNIKFLGPHHSSMRFLRMAKIARLCLNKLLSLFFNENELYYTHVHWFLSVQPLWKELRKNMTKTQS